MSNKDAFDDGEDCFLFKPNSITDSEGSLRPKFRIKNEFKTFNQSIFVISEGDLEAMSDSELKFGTEPKSELKSSLPSAKHDSPCIVDFKPGKR